MMPRARMACLWPFIIKHASYRAEVVFTGTHADGRFGPSAWQHTRIISTCRYRVSFSQAMLPSVVPQTPGRPPAGSGAWDGGMVVESLKWLPISRLGAPRATWPRLGSESARPANHHGAVPADGFCPRDCSGTAGKGAEEPLFAASFRDGGTPLLCMFSVLFLNRYRGEGEFLRWKLLPVSGPKRCG
jgi:hypothetical protein